MVPIGHFLQELVDLESGTTVVLGVLTEVPESQVAEHLAHGDSRQFNVLTDDEVFFLSMVFASVIDPDDLIDLIDDIGANVWFYP